MQTRPSSTSPTRGTQSTSATISSASLNKRAKDPRRSVSFSLPSAVESTFELASRARYEKLHAQVGILARSAGEVALHCQKRSAKASYKDANEPVTRGDKRTERHITDWIKSRYPEHAILGEEYGESGNTTAASMRWIIDPIDGTTNYMRGHPFWSVLIAVQEQTFDKTFETVVGCVYAPVEDALFTARKGGGCFLNGQRIHVSESAPLERSLLATDFAYEDKGSYARGNDQTLVRLRSLCQNVHVTGSSGLNLAYVAAGRYDGFWHKQLKPWDMAAGALLVEEAGGQVTDLFGDAFDATEGSIVATNAMIHAPLVDCIEATPFDEAASH